MQPVVCVGCVSLKGGSMVNFICLHPRECCKDGCFHPHPDDKRLINHYLEITIKAVRSDVAIGDGAGGK